MRFQRKNFLFALIVFVVLFYAVGLRIAHPHGGLSNALGSAQSGLVIYSTNTGTQSGSKVIINFPKNHQSPILGVIQGNEKGALTVQTGSKVELISKSQIRGRFLVMVPFLGIFLNSIGI